MADEVRMIDGNALKEDFMNDYDNYMMESLRGNHHDVVRITNVIDRIEDAPTIEAEPDNGWISVKDRLPDSKELYLICTEKRRIYIAYYQPIGDKSSNYEPFWQSSSCRFTSVTHWMHLPEPPKGE